MATREKNLVRRWSGTAKLPYGLYASFDVRCDGHRPLLRKSIQKGADSALKECRLRYAPSQKRNLTVQRSCRPPSYRSAAAAYAVHDLPLLDCNPSSEGSAELEQDERGILRLMTSPSALFVNTEHCGAKLVSGSHVDAVDFAVLRHGIQMDDSGRKHDR